MVQHLFKNLPPEILLNILSRIPARSTFSCKCVCKPWLDLLTTDEFVKSHLSKSVPGLAVCQQINPSALCVFDELGFEHVSAFPCNAVFILDSDVYDIVHSSVNGLLFINRQYPVCELSVWNPITRDSISIPCPPLPSSENKFIPDNYGFGVGKMSSLYKIVRIFNLEDPQTYEPLHQSKCQVYTLGTGLWRSIENSGLFRYGGERKALFMNGNLHWEVRDSESSPRISCFDVETELFSSFVAPSLLHNYYNIRSTLSVLKDCLCLCNNSVEDEIVIWLMKEYGDGNSWTKEFVIGRTSPVVLYGVFLPVKVFENGDVLIAKEGCSRLLCYSNRTNTIRKIDLLELYDHDGYDRTRVITYTPSLISLKSLAMEEVHS